ncbi:MAG: tryptophan--tRNA ligase [Puniceicoccales bacterium]|nr:tryptophan--tRNA ligase [Puniceicoccales bacterium]
MKSNSRQMVLTGLQPTASIQLGNYLGALQNWARMQNSHDCLFFISDMHAITVCGQMDQLRQRSVECIALYIACGIDPEKSCLFVQSQISGHTELAWILGCLASVGQLERMTQFKDKSRRNGDGFVGMGLLYYPILMAADILIYNAHAVPIGEDQRQHLELARDLAQRFNGIHGQIFRLPQPFIGDVCGRVMSLQDPSAKMSKSDPNPMGTVFLTDSDEEMAKKFRSAVTDCENSVRFSPEKPGISNLLQIFSGISGISISLLEERYGSSGYGKFKSDLADAVIERLSPIREKYFTLRKEREYLEKIIENGRQRAQTLANVTLRQVYDLIGFQRCPFFLNT